MSTREILLKAVLDAPDDDRPRLLFADWLDENKQGEWAEFIRLQCRFDPAPGAKAASPAREPGDVAAEERMKSMTYARYQNGLLGPLEALGLKFGSERFTGTPSRDEYYLDATFRRGFVEVLILFGRKNLQQFCKHAPAVFAQTPLRKLGLDDACGQEECWDWGGPAGYWDSTYDRLDDGDFKRLLALPVLRRIESFELWSELTPERARMFAASPNLSDNVAFLLHNGTSEQLRREVAGILEDRFRGSVEWV